MNIFTEKHLYFANLLASRFISASKRAEGISPETILCVKWDEIGDMASTLHVFSLLRQRYPEAEITVLCKPFVANMLENHPGVNHVITSVEEWKKQYQLVVELRGTWQTLWKSLHWKTMPNYRVDRGWVRFVQRGKQPHETVTNYRIIKPLLSGDERWDRKLYPSVAAEVNAMEWIRKCRREAEEYDLLHMGDIKGIRMAMVHVGARKVLRQWPLTNFAQLAQLLWENQRIWPIWVGVGDEKASVLEVQQLAGLGSAWIGGETVPEDASLLSFYAFMQQCDMFIGNESGPLQLADVAGIPLLGIFGPGVENVFYPLDAKVVKLDGEGKEIIDSVLDDAYLNAKNNKRVVHCYMDCNPCDQVHCVNANRPCIQRISVEGVYGTLLGIL